MDTTTKKPNPPFAKMVLLIALEEIQNQIESSKIPLITMPEGPQMPRFTKK